MAVNSVEVLYSDDDEMVERENVDNDTGNADTKGGNEGWADAMARILNKQLPGDKPVVLTKYKKGLKRNAEKKEETIKKRKRSDERHVMFEKDHVIPDKLKLTYDRELVHVATRGVVKLFNAVNKHQKETEAKLKNAPTESKKSKVMETMNKTAFLDMLKKSPNPNQDHTIQRGSKKEKFSRTEREERDESSSWSILRDDFMMGAKVKDWDKEDESENTKSETMCELGDGDDESNESDN